ncbi:MAG: DUF58 domain-containing protein [Actinobacteria bacterium]|nr:DUF58 domain-containing protein [Actinomycetota bacterium]
MYLETRSLLVVLLAVLAPVVTPGPAFLVLAIAMVVAVAVLGVDVLRAPDPASLRLDRRLPDATTVRRPASVTLGVRNPHDRRLGVALHDAAPPSLQRDPRRHRAGLPATGRVDLTATIEPTRRGDLPLGPVTVRIAGPLGLAGRQRTVELPDRIRVYPNLPGRAAVELRIERARLLQSGERSSRIRGGGTEFDSLREYHRDDEFRHINWRATARTAKPITNVYREERNQQVMVLLDTGRTMAGTVAGVARLELAIDGAMAIAELAGRIGDHVGTMAFARDVRSAIAPRTGRQHAHRILDALFDLDPTFDAPDYRVAFTRLLTRHRRRMLLVLLTELTHEAALDALYRAVPMLLRHHLLIVGAVRDPDVIAEAEQVPQDADGVYHKAAAVGALDARSRAAARLRSLGAQVVDEPPERFAGVLADHYLRIKATGRL